MRNIYKSPTQELTRLHFDVALFLSPNPQISREINSVVEGRNLYITNDELFKEGWYFNTSIGVNKPVFVKNEDVKTLKTIYGVKVSHLEKIILTTDPKLIEYGVQTIEDGFLQWYIKNPSCEEVEIVKKRDKWLEFEGKKSFIYKYKIIIPKEEQVVETTLDEKVAEILKGKELFKKSNDIARKVLSEIKSLPIVETIQESKQDSQEYDLLQHIKFCLVCNNESQAIRLIEKYGFQKQQEMYSFDELRLWLAHRDVYLYNYYTTYKKSGLPLETIEDFIKESHEYLMDREQFKKK